MTDRLIAQAGLENTIVINTGDNVFQTDEPELEHKKAEAIFRILDRIGIDFVGLGEQEFIFGVSLIGRLTKNTQVHLGCANVKDIRRVSPFLAPYLRLNKGMKQVLITSVIDPQILKSTHEKIVFTNPVTALKKIKETISHDIFIVVCHTDTARAEKWLTQVSGIDLVILGRQPGVSEKKLDINGAMVAFNNNRGQFVSHVDLVPNDGRYAVSGPLNTKLQSRTIPENRSIAKLIEGYEVWSREYHYAKSKNQRLANAPCDIENIYIGKDRCMECHEEIVVSWAKTRHATALESLIKKEKEYDPQCLPCHVTGMNDKTHDGGFVSLHLTPHMVNVQCEQCHGPGGRHAQDPENLSILISGEQTCMTCHTEASDPGFSYQKKQKTGIH